MFIIVYLSKSCLSFKCILYIIQDTLKTLEFPDIFIIQTESRVMPCFRVTLKRNMAFHLRHSSYWRCPWGHTWRKTKTAQTPFVGNFHNLRKYLGKIKAQIFSFGNFQGNQKNYLNFLCLGVKFLCSPFGEVLFFFFRLMSYF